MIRLFILTAVAVLLSAGTGLASKGYPEGAPAFSIYLESPPTLDERGEFVVPVWTFLHPDTGTEPATVQVDVLSGAEVVDGEMRRQITQSGRSFPVKLRRVGSEPIRVTGTLRISGAQPGSYYLARAVLVLRVEGNELIVQEKRVVQRIGFRNGIKFRYGRQYLVAIDDDEMESPVDIEAKPELLRTAVATCEGCALAEPVELEAVVTVRRDGSVTWPRPLSMDIPGEVWDAARKGLANYQFRPARSRGRAVADYAVVRVKVVPLAKR